MYVYIYIYTLFVCLYVYIYIYIYTHIHSSSKARAPERTRRRRLSWHAAQAFSGHPKCRLLSQHATRLGAKYCTPEINTSEIIVDF